MNKFKGGICAVVVTFMPELERLGQLLQSLASQVDMIVVVDNGSSDSVLAWLTAFNAEVQIKVFPLGDNRGIATAQNVGIRYARQQGAEYVILFDHDSCPAGDMVELLRKAAEVKAASGMKVAALGPRYLDARQNNPPPFLQVVGLRVIRQSCPSPTTVVDVDYLIASGCLMPMSTLDAVGDMQEELFIDYVDIEWGMRARSKGYQSFGVCGASMAHDLGEDPIRFFGRNIPHHSPLRHYYHFRNAVWMYRQRWVPLHWKLADGYRLILKYGFYTLFAKPRHTQFWMMTKGAWHGLLGRMGRLY